mmetsp:Transcript_35604/g.83238  ORF Transcript_35604/g.83238 Transcript_35604/m.83238 type:complete len:317 (+) Transcript_35604:153-1103(+)|eukprot:CAMPEP_0178422224 /NCGR_PEP_ID=MMETSP0689_2-20121128/27060_1 /TAXON_ID=160604 /ORGANISM="Amphidinium massartii, Strain CS-259" /LENGTH=316 /DNA_ID=CAMNT_0020043775 /DNA_START=125 /DNA_END=1075 /DNA_ORIENTATION=+
MRTINLLSILAFATLFRDSAAILLHSPHTDPPSHTEEHADTDAPATVAPIVDEEAVHAPESEPPPIPDGPPWHVSDKIQRPLMKSINTMRSALCMGRPDLARHEKCMRFLTRHCRSESTGHGYCEEFREFLAARCSGGDERSCAYKKQVFGEEELPESEAHAGEAEDAEVDDEEAPLANATGEEGVHREEPHEPAEPKELSPAEVKEEKEELVTTQAASTTYPSTSIKPELEEGFPDKAERALPDQGYSEHSSEEVEHNDGETYTSDWHSEFPRNGTSRASICQDQPDTYWCKLFLKDAKIRQIQTHSKQIAKAVA